MPSQESQHCLWFSLRAGTNDSLLEHHGSHLVRVRGTIWYKNHISVLPECAQLNLCCHVAPCTWDSHIPSRPKGPPSRGALEGSGGPARLAGLEQVPNLSTFGFLV